MIELSGRQRSVLGGVLLALVGFAAVFRAMTDMHVGTPANMGPGFFPSVLGACLALSGAGIAAGALFQKQSRTLAPALNLRAIGLVVLAIVAFALTVRPLGLVPAAFVLVLIAGFADRRSRLAMILLLALAFAFLSWLIFLVGLNMPLQAFAF